MHILFHWWRNKTKQALGQGRHMAYINPKMCSQAIFILDYTKGDNAAEWGKGIKNDTSRKQQSW